MSDPVDSLAASIAQLREELAEAEAYIGDLEREIAELRPAATTTWLRYGEVKMTCPYARAAGGSGS